MLIEFRSADRMLGLKALSIYGKMIDAAKAACEKVYAPTLYLDSEKMRGESAGDWLQEKLDEMGVGEVREIDMPSELGLSLRCAGSVYLSQLTKLSEKQSDLLVPQEETNEVTSHVTSLVDRLRGQIEMAGVNDSATTIKLNDGPEVSMDDFHRAADVMTGRHITH